MVKGAGVRYKELSLVFVTSLVFIEMGETKSEGIYKTDIIRSVERSST